MTQTPIPGCRFESLAVRLRHNLESCVRSRWACSSGAEDGCNSVEPRKSALGCLNLTPKILRVTSSPACFQTRFQNWKETGPIGDLRIENATESCGNCGRLVLSGRSDPIVARPHSLLKASAPSGQNDPLHGPLGNRRRKHLVHGQG